MIKRTYAELMELDTFEDRFRYLELKGRVGRETFGAERTLNQSFYRSSEWKHIRKYVIARDLGMDLAMVGYEIFDTMIIHHMNPMTVDDIRHGDPAIIDPKFLITTSLDTHNQIHYGNHQIAPRTFAERSPGDTVLW